MTEADERALVIQTTDRGDGPVFERFFAAYDRAFVLPDEKENVEGFRACLALNHGAAHRRLVAEYGPFREMCLVADDADGKPVGGANLIAMPLRTAREGHVVTVNLNYIFIEPGAQGRGNLRRLMDRIRRLVPTLFGEPAPRTLVFIEQNDPFAMTEENYRSDSAYTGLDQIDRLRIWSRLGAAILDLAYVQPPLTPAHAADDCLIYAVIGADEGSVSACLVQEHLRRFFGISVLKGSPLEEEPVARTQLAALGARCAAGEAVCLLNPASFLEALGDRDSARALFGHMPASARDAIEAFARLSR